jgi:hypothetical protein
LGEKRGRVNEGGKKESRKREQTSTGRGNEGKKWNVDAREQVKTGRETWMGASGNRESKRVLIETTMRSMGKKREQQPGEQTQ